MIIETTESKTEVGGLHLTTYIDKIHRISTLQFCFEKNEFTRGRFDYDFETMIFSEAISNTWDYQVRYKTEEEARKGHKTACLYLQRLLGGKIGTNWIYDF